MSLADRRSSKRRLTEVSASCLTWGAITMGTAWAKEYTHLIAIRVLLGVFEAGLFPCISVYATPLIPSRACR